MSEDFSDVKLPDEFNLEEWFIGDTIVIPNDFEEGPFDIDWYLVGEFARDHLCEYLGDGWAKAGVRITWNDRTAWWHEQDSDCSFAEIYVFGPKAWIDEYKRSSLKDHGELEGPWPVTKLAANIEGPSLPFYDSMKDSPTRALIEGKGMSPEEWKAHCRAEAEKAGVFHLYVDANEPDVIEAQYLDFISDRTNDSDIEYGEDGDKVPQFSTTVHGGAIECTMTFHTWQDAEEFMIDVYGEGLPADQWEDAGLEHPDYYLYGEDPESWK